MHLRSLAFLVPCLACLAVACGREAPRSAPETLELVDQEMYRVALDRPRTVTGPDGSTREVGETFVVRLELAGMPEFQGARTDIFVGDERIIEYGGWARGVYFTVPDEIALRAMMGRPLRYRLPYGEVKDFGQTLESIDPGELPRIDQAELRRRSR